MSLAIQLSMKTTREKKNCDFSINGLTKLFNVHTDINN